VAAGLAEPDRRVIIVEPKASWPSEFDAISRSLRDALGPLAVRIDNIGSTARTGRQVFERHDVRGFVHDRRWDRLRGDLAKDALGHVRTLAA